MKKSFFERVEAEVVNESQRYIKNKVKKKLFRLGEVSLFIFLSFVLISFGLALIIGNFFPKLNGGFNFLLLGLIFLIAGFLLNR